MTQQCDTETVPERPLSIAQCDEKGCPAAALVRFESLNKSGLYLDFCGHHGQQNVDSLAKQHFIIVEGSLNHGVSQAV